MSTDPQALAPQWDAAKPLFQRWRSRARLNQDSHWEAAKRLEQRHYIIGVPVVILSAIVGTTVFATLQKQVGLEVQLAIGAVSIVTAVLAGLQTFLGYSKRAEQHKSTAASYGAIRRRLESAFFLPVERRDDLAQMVKETQAELDNLARTAPTIPDAIYKVVKARLDADPDDWTEKAIARQESPIAGSIVPPSAAAFTGPAAPFAAPPEPFQPHEPYQP